METITTYYNYTFNIGLFDKDTKTQVIPTQKAKKIIKNLTVKYLWFGTISNKNIGVYTHDNWDIISEPSYEVNFKTQNPDRKNILEYVINLKKQLNQESILVSYTMENVNFM